MGSHIPIRQLRRSSVNARPRGTTFRGLVVSIVFTTTWATSPLLCRFSVSKRSPRCSSTTVGLRPLSRDISSGFSDSLFFPSALFNSLVRRFGRSSGTYSLEAGPGGPVTSLRQFTGQRPAPPRPGRRSPGPGRGRFHPRLPAREREPLPGERSAVVPAFWPPWPPRPVRRSGSHCGRIWSPFLIYIYHYCSL